MHIEIKKGLNIPIEGRPHGEATLLLKAIRGSNMGEERRIALDLSPFTMSRLSLLIEEGAVVKMGQPLAALRSDEEYCFLAPAAGKVVEIRRGPKRTLLAIVIEKATAETDFERAPLNIETIDGSGALDFLRQGGVLPYIKERPFGLLPNGKIKPRSIFISAIDSLPFDVPPKEELSGHETLFQAGLSLLNKISPKAVHLVFRPRDHALFENFNSVNLHTVDGPHPAKNSSLHIEKIDPILDPTDHRWTLSLRTVLIIGSLALKGRFFTEKVVAIGGEGFSRDQIGFFKTREGIAIETLIQGRLNEQLPSRLISGDVLIGHKVEATDFLGFFDQALVAIPNPDERQFLHFFRLGTDKYTASRAYLSGFLAPPENGYAFTTSQHGEERAFVDATLYQKVNPLSIPVMELIKALMARDFEAAEELGFLGVAPEDFALPTFVCPSKIPMIDIFHGAVASYLAE